MKIYKLTLITLLACFLFSCAEKETDNLSRSTYYVAFEILGDNPAIVPVNDAYVDAGAKATLQGNDVSSTMKVASNVDDQAMGIYRVEYSAVNADNLTSRAIREVIVCNPTVTANIAGTWLVSTTSYRINPDESKTPYGGEGKWTVKINRLAPGFFSVDDILAGWYSQGAYPQYGTDAALTGNFSLNDDNIIDVVSTRPVPIFGPPNDLSSFANAVYNPDAVPETITWDAGFAGAYTFHVELTKQIEEEE